MKILFIVYQFSDAHLRLQPWRYVKEVVNGLATRDHDITVITDAALSSEALNSKVNVIDRSTISPFKIDALRVVLKQINADVIFWPIGAKSLLYFPLLNKYRNITVGYLPGPIWTIHDMCSCMRHGLVTESIQALLWQLVQSSGCIKVMSKMCSRFLVLSNTNKTRLIRQGISDSDIVFVAPVYDQKTMIDEGSGVSSFAKQRKVALFMGWPKKLRGVHLLLDAFGVVAKKDQNIDLLVLARGDKTKEHDDLENIVRNKGLFDRVTIINGFLPSKEVRGYVRNCSFGILPFIHVPADCPLSFLEFFAAGKPIITTDASGVSDLVVDGRGLIAKRNGKSLAEAILAFACMDEEELGEYRRACLTYAEQHNSWDKVVECVERDILTIVEGIKCEG